MRTRSSKKGDNVKIKEYSPCSDEERLAHDQQYGSEADADDSDPYEWDKEGENVMGRKVRHGR